MFRRTIASELPAADDTPPESKPWDAEWLAENCQNQHSIASHEALLQSSEFHRYMRQKGGALTCHNILKTLQLYRDLRALAPADFRKVWEDPNIQELVVLPVSFRLAAIEYIAEVIPTAYLVLNLNVPLVKMLLTKFVQFPEFDQAPLVLLLLFFVQWQWVRRQHSKLLGWLFGIYQVMENTEDCASTLEILASHVLEVLCVVYTFGIWIVISLTFKFWFVERPSVCDKMLRIGLLREVKRPMIFEEEKDEE